MKSRAIKIAIALAIVLLVSGMAWIALRHGGAKSQDNSEAQTVRVQVVKPQKGGLERTVTRPASIHAFEHAELYAKQSGFLQHQVVDIGSVVKKGQLLAQIYAPEFRAAVQKAQADVNKAQSMVEVDEAILAASKADLTEVQAKLEETRADLEKAKANLVYRQKQYQRIYDLAKLNAIQQKMVDEQLAARDSAQASERAAVQAIITAQSAVLSAEAHVTQAHATVKDAHAEIQVRKAMLDQAQVQEEYTNLRAPFDGVITDRHFHDGDFIRSAANGGTTPVLAISDEHLMRVIVWLPDDVVPFVRVGEAAAITPFAFATRTALHGTITRTAVSENYSSRTMRVEVDLPNPKHLLNDGMYGSGTIFLGKNPNALTIPSDCLVGQEEKSDERNLYVVRAGKAQKLTVHVGLQDGIHAEVLSGLKPEDEVIKSPGPGIADGAPVQVVEG